MSVILQNKIKFVVSKVTVRYGEKQTVYNIEKWKKLRKIKLR